MRDIPILLAIVTAVCMHPLIEAKRPEAEITIAPGPAEMSSEERQLAADPARGTEHAVLILEQEEWDQGYPTSSELSYHLRAKILSNEGRDLANVSFPSGDRIDLREWWGRVIHPDGTVHELKRDELVEQTTVEFRGLELGAHKAALPAVEPGVVIDYGYTVRIGYTLGPPTFVLQQSYRLLRGEYRWKPITGMPGSYWLRNDPKGSIEVRTDGRAIVFEVEDLAPADEEKYAPPPTATNATVRLYYRSNPEEEPGEFWEREARRMTDWTDRFVRHRRSLRKLAEQIPLPEGADFRTRMAAVYDWVVDNIDNESRRSVEELETAHSEDEDDVRNTAKHVIEAGRGKGRQIDRVFIGLARALGAQADGLYAVDRRRAFFDPNLLSSAQFDGMLVVVRPPGARDESSIICDPSTAMPFGRVPWWFTGTTGLLVVDDEHRTMQIPPAPPEENATTSEVDIRFAEQNEIYEVDWTQTLAGQDARRTRRWLRQMHVDEREETVRAECGESADLEVLEAAVHELEDPQSPLSFSCTGEVFTAGISGDVGTFHFTPGGPWFDALPELRDDERRTHVIFDHLRRSRSVVTVHPPDGFVLGPPPAPVELDNGVCLYRLQVEESDGAFRVERTFLLRSLVIAPEHYEALASFFQQAERAEAIPVVFHRVGSQP